jgi:hypothetical protein
MNLTSDDHAQVTNFCAPLPDAVVNAMMKSMGVSFVSRYLWQLLSGASNGWEVLSSVPHTNPYNAPVTFFPVNDNGVWILCAVFPHARTVMVYGPHMPSDIERVMPFFLIHNRPDVNTPSFEYHLVSTPYTRPSDSAVLVLSIVSTVMRSDLSVPLSSLPVFEESHLLSFRRWICDCIAHHK